MRTRFGWVLPSEHRRMQQAASTFAEFPLARCADELALHTEPGSTESDPDTAALKTHFLDTESVHMQSRVALGERLGIATGDECGFDFVLNILSFEATWCLWCSGSGGISSAGILQSFGSWSSKCLDGRCVVIKAFCWTIVFHISFTPFAASLAILHLWRRRRRFSTPGIWVSHFRTGGCAG